MTRYEQLQEHLKDNQSTWLVTGVAGFIGSNLLEKLLILNQKVVGLDSFDTGYQHNVDQAIQDANDITGKDLSNNFKFINGDIKKLSDCKLACDGVDYVLHQAALGSVPRSIEDPIATNEANINGFVNMLVASRDAKVKRFVYAASSSSYGDNPDLPKVEHMTGNPLSPYAVTKIVNELYANVFAKNYDFKTIGLRYFNIFGKRQDPNGAYAAVIPKWIDLMINREQVLINGDGMTSRDFCYVDNAVQANILAAVSSEEYKNEVYNVAVGDRTNLNDLFYSLRSTLIENDKQYSLNPKYQDFRDGDVRHSQANISKAKEMLSYQPSHSLIDGINEIIPWYIRNLEGK